jgi:hypothetical protein
MTDLYIKSTGLGAFKADLPQFVGEDGELITASHAYALDHVGQIVDVPGEYDADGKQITAPTFVPGEHFNLRCVDENLAVALQGLTLANTVIINPEPATPSRVWA